MYGGFIYVFMVVKCQLLATETENGNEIGGLHLIIKQKQNSKTKVASSQNS